MLFHSTTVEGAFVIEPERHHDVRGFFARIWCHEELAAHGLNPQLAQCSTSFNTKRGTLRGMHWQEYPHQEAKLVRCTRGSIYDVVVDLRVGSQTFRRYCAEELSSENGKMLYIPEGCAHGFLTLTDNTEVLYFISADYAPEYQRGMRWNDPAIGIKWPESIQVMSDRDKSFPDFKTQK